MIDLFIDELDLRALGVFGGVVRDATGCPALLVLLVIL
jgi:hypothetical protein